MWNKDLDRAMAEAERTIALDPNSAIAYSILGNIPASAGRAPEAVAHIEKAMRLDPQYPDIYLHFIGHARILLGDYEGAARDLQRRIRRKPDTDSSRILLASCHGHLGRAEDARAEWDAALEINPGFSLDQRASVLPYTNPDDWRRILDGLAKAGLVE